MPRWRIVGLALASELGFEERSMLSYNWIGIDGGGK